MIPLARRRFVPAAVIALVVAGSLLCSLLLPHGAVPHLLQQAERLRGLGLAGWILFVAGVAFVALIGIVPGALLGLAAGAVYGVTAGAIGIGCGAVIAFGLSRSIMRPLIADAVGAKRIAILDQVMSDGSWRLVALLRVSPIMPFSLTSYALGLSGITMRNYLLGSLAALPALFGYVIIGMLGGSTLEISNRGSRDIHAGLLGLGALATFGLTVYLTRLVARLLRRTAASPG